MKWSRPSLSDHLYAGLVFIGIIACLVTAITVPGLLLQWLANGLVRSGWYAWLIPLFSIGTMVYFLIQLYIVALNIVRDWRAQP